MDLQRIQCHFKTLANMKTYSFFYFIQHMHNAAHTQEEQKEKFTMHYIVSNAEIQTFYFKFITYFSLSLSIFYTETESLEHGKGIKYDIFCHDKHTHTPTPIQIPLTEEIQQKTLYKVNEV